MRHDDRGGRMRQGGGKDLAGMHQAGLEGADGDRLPMQQLAAGVEVERQKMLLAAGAHLVGDGLQDPRRAIQDRTVVRPRAEAPGQFEARHQGRGAARPDALDAAQLAERRRAQAAGETGRSDYARKLRLELIDSFANSNDYAVIQLVEKARDLLHEKE